MPGPMHNVSCTTPSLKSCLGRRAGNRVAIQCACTGHSTFPSSRLQHGLHEYGRPQCTSVAQLRHNVFGSLSRTLEPPPVTYRTNLVAVAWIDDTRPAVSIPAMLLQATTWALLSAPRGVAAAQVVRLASKPLRWYARTGAAMRAGRDAGRARMSIGSATVATGHVLAQRCKVRYRHWTSKMQRRSDAANAVHGRGLGSTVEAWGRAT